MTLRKNRVPKTVLVLLAVLFSLALVSFILVSEFIVPKEVSGYLEGISRDKGYEIRIKNVEFGLFTGLKGEGIEIFDPFMIKPILRIEEVVIVPDILRFLLDQRIRVRGIIIDGSVLSLTKEGFGNLMKSTEAGTYRDKKKRPLPIEIGHVEIRNAQIEVMGVFLSSKRIDLGIGDAHPEGEKTIELSGSITLMNNELGIEVRIKPFLKVPVGELKINLLELNIGAFSNAVKPPVKLAVSSNLRFRISDTIDSQGTIDLVPSETKGEKESDLSGRLEYDFHYDRTTDTAFIESLKLDVNRLILISIGGNIEGVTAGGILDLRGKAEGIELERLAKWFPALSDIGFSGNAEAGDIRVTGSIKDRSLRLRGDVTLNGVRIKDKKNGFQIEGSEGRLEVVSIRFTGDDKRGLYTELSFSARGLNVGTEGKTIRASRVESMGPLRIVFPYRPETHALPENTSPSQKADSKALNRGGGRMSVESNGLYYEDLSFGRFSIVKGSVNKLSFGLEEGNKWTLDLYSTGSRFRVKEYGIYLKEIRARIQAERNGKLSLWGGMDGKEGGYRGFLFPRLLADFRLSGNSLRLTNLESQIEGYGELRVKDIRLIPEDGKNGPSYRLAFDQGSFSAFNGRVKSEGIKGGLLFYTGKNKVISNGDVYIRKGTIASQELNDLSLRLTLSQDGIKLEGISGRFLNGDIRGSAVIKTAKFPVLFSSHIELERASIPLGKLRLGLEKLDLDFKGGVNETLFPKGRGEIRLVNLVIEKGGIKSSLSGNVHIETVGETVSIKEGFIENGEGRRISITVKMEDSLKGDRSLEIDLPRIPLAFLQETLSPILPQVMREGESMGDIGLSLNIDRFLEEETSLKGRIHVKGASFIGGLNGTPILIKDVNGGIPIKGEDKPPISLVPLIGYYLEPDRLVSERAFRDFLHLAKRDGMGDGEELIKIERIEYGFLRLRDIECRIELNKERINLRRFKSKLYRGLAFGTGVFDFGGKEGTHDVSFLFKNISLMDISSSIPSTKDYISGRVNGLAWVRGKGYELKTLSGVFGFWAIESEKEPRRVGKALLMKLGVRERFFLRPYRKYDEGEIQGYIKGGVITFKELKLLNETLGIRDLSIRVDKKRNSISVVHLLSVIRETAKRAGRGELRIEFKDKR